MKKQLLLSVAAGALAVINPAFAADMPVKAPVYRAPVVAAYNWTGCYLGGNVGYSWGRAKGDFNAPDLATGFGITSAFSVSQHLDGVIGGGQIGCNWQTDRQWVLGIETDFQGSGEKDTFGFSDPFSDGEGVATHSIESKIQWFGTLRARAGYLITPTLMLYGTGGLAYGKVSVFDTITFASSPGRTPQVNGTAIIGDSNVNVGWTVGAGIEGALLNWQNWTWKVEYLYIDLGSLSGAGTDPLAGTFNWNAKFTDNIVRVGLNYKFR
jgi:outer membrane immunogenic protein